MLVKSAPGVTETPIYERLMLLQVLYFVTGPCERTEGYSYFALDYGPTLKQMSRQTKSQKYNMVHCPNLNVTNFKYCKKHWMSKQMERIKMVLNLEL